MTDFPLNIELDVDASAGAFPDIAHYWLDALSAAVTPRERAELKDLPARSRTITDAAGSLGVPGTLFGVVELEHWHDDEPPTSEKRTLSDRGLAWLREQLTVLPTTQRGGAPYRATAWIGHLDETGQRSGNMLFLDAKLVEHSPGWMKLNAYIPSSRFAEPSNGLSAQRRWLDALGEIADRLNPGYGGIDYHHHPTDSTAIEATMSRRIPGRERNPLFTISQCRSRLRGYSWLTILAQELADRLGGFSRLADSGAFAEVRPLSRGGVWLLTTQDFREYNTESARAAFNVLAPLLPSGMPMAKLLANSQEPMFVVLEDPDEVQNSD